MQLVSQVRKLEGRLIQIEKNHDNFQREVKLTEFFSNKSYLILRFLSSASTKTITD
jgi:hypothetical protein